MAAHVVTGPVAVTRALRAAGPLTARVGAPVTARAPWLTAVVRARVSRPWEPMRPVAVSVRSAPDAPPAAAAFLSVRSRPGRPVVTLLGQDARPLPGGRPAGRLPAVDDGAAAQLAAAVLDLLGTWGGRWELRLAGLPLGDPTVRALAAALPRAELSTVRSRRLVDELDPGAAVRSRDPRTLERWLPQLLLREPDPRARPFLRAAARLHAALGQLELAVVADGEQLRAAVLTLLDGGERWTWWGSSDVGGLREELGSPLVALSARPDRRPLAGR